MYLLDKEEDLSTILGFLLKYIYQVVGHYGMAIIVFTIVVKLCLLPLTAAQNKSMASMQEIQPLMDDIKKKYPDNKEKQNQLIMELYQKYKVNPMMGCLPILIQFPILIGLFNVLREPVKYVFSTQAAYTAADTGFLWIKSMATPDVIVIAGLTIPFILPVVAAISTFFESYMMQKGQPKNPTTAVMLYMMPIMILVWGVTFPAGLSLYWAVSNIFSIIQRSVTAYNKKMKKEATKGGSKGAKK